MKTAFLVTSLLLILVANLIMVYYAPNGLSPMEGFQNIPAMNGVSGGNMGNMGNTASGMPQMGGFQNVPPMNGVSGGIFWRMGRVRMKSMRLLEHLMV